MLQNRAFYDTITRYKIITVQIYHKETRVKNIAKIFLCAEVEVLSGFTTVIIHLSGARHLSECGKKSRKCAS